MDKRHDGDYTKQSGLKQSTPCCISALEGPPIPQKEPKFYSEHSLPWTLGHRTRAQPEFLQEIAQRRDRVISGVGFKLGSSASICCKVGRSVRGGLAGLDVGGADPRAQRSGIWNPLVDFMDVKEDGQMGDVQSLNNFYTAVKNTSACGLPNVSWITPNSKVSEHPPALVSAGQAYVTTLINSIVRSPC